MKNVNIEKGNVQYHRTNIRSNIHRRINMYLHLSPIFTCHNILFPTCSNKIIFHHYHRRGHYHMPGRRSRGLKYFFKNIGPTDTVVAETQLNVGHT